MSTENIINDFWNYVEIQKEKTKIGKRIYDWLNEDNLHAICQEKYGVYWLERTCSFATIPNYAWDYIEKWCKKRGLTYLYKKYPVE